MNEICGDNRFEVIEQAKQDLLKRTNIDTSPDEMAVLDTFLFRCWQMGWLRGYEPPTVVAKDMSEEKLFDFKKAVEADNGDLVLVPINPTTQWIDRGWKYVWRYECSSCHGRNTWESKFCPCCGAEVRSEE